MKSELLLRGKATTQTPPLTDRRTEPRTSVDEVVHLAVIGPGWVRVEATLLDFSRSGFRARHNSLQVTTGDKVAFRHGHARGVAVSVWTRADKDVIESGFRVLQQWEAGPIPGARKGRQQ